MGLLERVQRMFLSEDALKVRLAANPERDHELGISGVDDDITEKQIGAATSLIDATDVDKFTTLSKYRDERYEAYEEMLADPIISAALEMYADDSTPYNADNRIVWAESDDPVIAEAANRLIKVLGIEGHAWRDIYSLCTYGDLYFRLYREGDESEAELDNKDGETAQITVKPHDKTRKLEERIEYVNNPAAIFDLQEKDKTTGFIRMRMKPSQQTQGMNKEFLSGFNQPISTVAPNSFDMMNNTSYVHVCLSESVERFPNLLAIKDDDGQTTDIYKIKTGKSLLEDAYPVTRQLKLLQDSLLLNRLTKSALIRLLQIEVGDMPKNEANLLVQRVKGLMEQKMAINTESGAARSYNSPGPVENIIYIPTKGGKGAINQVTIGGDINVKDIVDVDYFQNKQLAALKIPKQYLNFDAPEGLSNGANLTKVSSRYAHTIMRIQAAYSLGITNVLNLFFIDKNLDYVGKFTIKMVTPTTAEDAERSEILTNRISQVRDIMDIYADYDEDTRHEILKALTADLLQIPSISDIFNRLDTKDLDDTVEDESDIDNMPDSNMPSGFGESPNIANGPGEDLAETPDTFAPPENGPAPSTAVNDALSDLSEII